MQVNPKKPILVVGVTGRHGGTGASVARALLARGVPVRALVRKLDERAASWEREGAELVVGNLHDRRSLVSALADVDTAFFTYPVAAGIVEAAANLAAAGRTAGLRRIVTMSMGASNPESPSPLGRAQWLAESVLEWSGLACLHLRIAAFFFENIALLHSKDIARDNALVSSYTDIPAPWIAAEDAAKLAVVALLSPERFGEATSVYPTGSHHYTYAEIARIVGEHLGRPLRHEAVSQADWQRRLTEHAAHDPRISPAMAEHISALGAAVRAPWPSNDLFERLTGEKPQSLNAALESGRLAFTDYTTLERL